MNLLLDIGNSRIKWCALQDGQLAPMHAAIYEPATMAGWCTTHLADWRRPDAVLVANVAGPGVATALSDWCRAHWQLEPRFASTGKQAGGIRNGYRDSSQLGVDRWLALIAARRITTGPVCVISCGTAITVDALNANGEHLGGVIAPGPDLMYMALDRGTRGARAPGLPAAELALGRDTAAGIAGGVSYALVGMIERLVMDLRQQLTDDIQCLITGGGAGTLVPLCRLPLRVVDDLVLRGLAHYAEER